MTHMQRISACLWFDGQAEDAAKFYTSIFKRSKIGTVTRYGEVGPGPKGTVMTVIFELDGQEFMALNGGPEFTFNEAVSFIVHCDTQEEIDEYWEKLSVGGRTVQCGWLKDQFGVSWQIVPAVLRELMRDGDPDKTNRVMKAILGMVKLDIKRLRQAYAGQ
jgi:predicted 3-demethylubiquinone-9 3-methyltransferase (glyoxalase superfamily)